MTSYEAALSKMVIENNLKSDADIDNWADDDCSNTRAYFKPTRNGDDNCTFMTADGVWWNISDIKNPVISVDTKTGIDPTKLADLKNTAKDTSDNKIYAMKGWFDENGSLRVDDLAKVGDNDKAYLTKLYNFVNNKIDSSSGEVTQKSPFDECKEKGQDTCTVNGITYTPKQFTAQCYDFPDWASDDTEHYGTQSCGTTGTFWVAELGYPEDYDTQAKDYEGSTCYDCKDTGCGDYYNAAKRCCESSGGRLPTLGELISGGYTDGFFWAAEEYDSGLAYGLGFGDVYSGYKGDYADVVCVGN